MKKILLLICATLLGLNANAREVNDVSLAENVKLGNANLQLNGAGTRVKIVIDIYVAALYLETKKQKAEEVLSDIGSKRVEMHILYGMSTDSLLNAFKKAIEANHSAAELSVLDTQLKKFYAIFGVMSSVNKGDVILLDYLPGTGTRVTINGVERGVVEGAEVNRALLKIWLGSKLVEESLKNELLGVK
jgi:hypothetical protein